MEGAAKWLLEYILGVNMFDDMIKILTINPSAGQYKPVWDTACSIHTTFVVPVASMVMFMFFIIAIVDKMTMENFTWEQLWRQLCMLLASAYLITNALEILATLYSIGIVFVNNIYEGRDLDSDKSFMDQTDDLIKGFQDNFGDGFFGDLLLILFLLVPFIGAWLIRMAVIIICYTRLIELFIRTIFAPIALADFFHSGLQGAGWRYLKNYLAVALQGAVLLCIGIIFSSLVGTITANTTNLFSYIGTVLAFTFSGAALMFKSLSLTKELLGTG